MSLVGERPPGRRGRATRGIDAHLRAIGVGPFWADWPRVVGYPLLVASAPCALAFASAWRLSFQTIYSGARVRFLS